VSPECRLAPEHPFPAAADDTLAVARWLAREAAALGASQLRPAVAGDSSGGNLAATVAHALTREGAPPSFQVLIYPMLDATGQLSLLTRTTPRATASRARSRAGTLTATREGAHVEHEVRRWVDPPAWPNLPLAPPAPNVQRLRRE
jgi:acetyl esterase/lipase